MICHSLGHSPIVFRGLQLIKVITALVKLSTVSSSPCCLHQPALAITSCRDKTAMVDEVDSVSSSRMFSIKQNWRGVPLLHLIGELVSSIGLGRSD